MNNHPSLRIAYKVVGAGFASELRRTNAVARLETDVATSGRLGGLHR